MISRQELYCHCCSRYVQFDVDMELNGYHVLTCPVCGHLHYREVVNGEITENRWGSSNAAIATNSFPVTNVTSSHFSTWNTYSGTSSTINTNSSIFLYQSWLNTTS